MRHIQHPSNNGTLGAPAGVRIEDCRALPVTHIRYEQEGIEGGMPAVVSFWQPTPEEVMRIVNGEPLFVSIWGHTHAPLLLGVGSPV